MHTILTGNCKTNMTHMSVRTLTCVHCYA